MISGELNKYGGMVMSAPGYTIQIGIKATTIADNAKRFHPNVLLGALEQNPDVVYALMLDATGTAIAGTESMVGTQYEDEVTIAATQKGERGPPDGWMRKPALPPMMSRFPITRVRC